DFGSAEAASPEGDGKPDRTRTEDEHFVAGLHAGEVHPVERDCQRLDDRAIGQTDVLRQADALVGPRQRVLGVAAALQAEAGAPLYLALPAVLAVTAAHQRDDRNEIAGFQAFSLAAERDHFACELVPKHVAVMATVSRILGHVQVAAADAA